MTSPSELNFRRRFADTWPYYFTFTMQWAYERNERAKQLGFESYSKMLWIRFLGHITALATLLLLMLLSALIPLKAPWKYFEVLAFTVAYYPLGSAIATIYTLLIGKGIRNDLGPQQ